MYPGTFISAGDDEKRGPDEYWRPRNVVMRKKAKEKKAQELLDQAKELEKEGKLPEAIQKLLEANQKLLEAKRLEELLGPGGPQGYGSMHSKPWIGKHLIAQPQGSIVTPNPTTHPHVNDDDVHLCILFEQVKLLETKKKLVQAEQKELWDLDRKQNEILGLVEKLAKEGKLLEAKQKLLEAKKISDIFCSENPFSNAGRKPLEKAYELWGQAEKLEKEGKLLEAKQKLLEAKQKR